MRVSKVTWLSSPVHEEGIFLHLEEKRRVRRLIPEEGKLGLGHEFYLQSLGPTAFEQGYRGAALEARVAPTNLSVEQPKVNVGPLDARKLDTADNLV
jgi:hypothetical protein